MSEDAKAVPPNWSEDVLWGLEVTRNAIILIGAQREVNHANAAAGALAERVLAGSGPEYLLGLLPEEA